MENKNYGYVQTTHGVRMGTLLEDSYMKIQQLVLL